jgi:hypothetical protein
MIGYGNSMFLATHGILARSGGGGASLLLDTYTGAAVAYSLRQLRTAYTGAAIRVRRSSDNAEQDFGFVNNVLDTASLLTFCGAGNGFITTWYDQSGNGLNLTMTVAANQPRIVNAGVIDSKNNTTAMKFDGINDVMSRTALTALNSGNNLSYFTVSSSDITSRADTVFISVNSGSPRLENFLDTRTTGGFYRNFGIQNTVLTSYNADLSAANGSTNQRLLSGFLNGFNMSAFDNGNTGGTSTYTGTYINNSFVIGSYPSVRNLNGYIQEIILYPTDQSSNRVGIESNINTYYTIF